MAAKKTPPQSNAPRAPKGGDPKPSGRKKKPKIVTDGKGTKAAEPAKQETLIVRSYRRDLTVNLSQDECQEMSQLLAAAVHGFDTMKANHKEQAAQNRSSLNEVNNEIRRLSNIVASRQDQREVSCEKRLDYDKKLVTEVRLDTGKTLSEREMNSEELQRNLFDTPANLDDEFNIPDDELPKPGEGEGTAPTGEPATSPADGATATTDDSPKAKGKRGKKPPPGGDGLPPPEPGEPKAN
jgi:hypothetical protein